MRVPPISQSQYEVYLGGSEDKLKAHIQRIFISIQSVIDSGGRFNMHMDWAAIETKADLKLRHVKKVRKKTPGYDFYEPADYRDLFGDLETSGMRDKGHREYELDGKNGFLVPEKGPVKLRFEEQLSSEYTSHVGSNEGDDALTGKQLTQLHSSLSAGLWSGTSGGVSGSLSILDSEPKAAGGQGDASSLFSGLCGTGRLALAAEESVAASPEAKPATGGKRKGTTSKPRGGASKAAPKPKPSDAIVLAAPAAASDAIVPASSDGADPQGSPRPAPKKGTVGRTKRDFASEVKAEMDSFARSRPESVLYWGREAGTKLRVLGTLTEAMKTRVRNVTCMVERAELAVLQKSIACVSALISTAMDHGMQSTKFKEMHDEQIGFLNLPPIVDVQMPDHVQAQIGLLSLGDTRDPAAWIRAVSNENPLANEAKKQEKLYSEKVAMLLREAISP